MLAQLADVCTWALERIHQRNLTRDQLMDLAALLQVVAYEVRENGNEFRSRLGGPAAESDIDELAAQARWMRDEAQTASDEALFHHVDRALHAACTLTHAYQEAKR